MSVFQYLVMNSVGHAVNQRVFLKHSNQSLNVVGCLCTAFACVSDYNFHLLRFLGERILFRNHVLLKVWLLGRMSKAATRSPPCGGGMKSQHSLLLYSLIILAHKTSYS